LFEREDQHLLCLLELAARQEHCASRAGQRRAADRRKDRSAAGSATRVRAASTATGTAVTAARVRWRRIARRSDVGASVAGVATVRRCSGKWARVDATGRSNHVRRVLTTNEE
jgi:hypothetical protein